jgi:hypothetical protein
MLLTVVPHSAQAMVISMVLTFYNEQDINVAHV